MPDNETTGTGKAVATDKVTYSGDADQNVQLIRLVQTTGSEGSKTVVDLPGDAANGLDVDVTRLPALAAGTNNIGDVDVLTLPGVKGTVAHDAADADAPVKVGLKAATSLDDATMVSGGDVTDAFADIDGVQITKMGCPDADFLTERVSNTDGASTALTTFGATASTRNVISSIIVYNDSTTNGYVDIRDGTSGTVYLTIPLPAKGGCVVNFARPWRQPSANTALAYDVSAALTTVYLSFCGWKSKA
jgi:hypothetical protein